MTTAKRKASASSSPPPTARTQSRGRSTKTAPRATKKSATPRRRGTPEARLAALESRLADLPVDALIDLRDNLEDLLAADAVDEAAVRRLLDSSGL